MFTRLTVAIVVFAAGQMIPATASACVMSPAHALTLIDSELPKAKLTPKHAAQVAALRTRAQEFMAANKPYEATRAAQNALAIIGYNPPGPPTRC